MNLLARITPISQTVERSSFPSIAWGDYQSLVSSQFLYGGVGYSTLGDDPNTQFENLVDLVHSQNNVVSGAVVARQFVMSQVRFAWRNVQRTSPNYRQLFGSADLGLLERPDPGNLTRPMMLGTSESHQAYHGNTYIARHADHLELLNPSLVRPVLMGVDDPLAVIQSRQGRKAGYLYYRNGNDDPAPEPWPLDKVIHWASEPHPVRWWLGQSWVTSLLAEIMLDKSSTKYLREFFAKAATPNLIVKPHEMLSSDQIDAYRDVFAKEYAGVGNAFKTMWLGGGSDVTVVGSSLADLDLKALQGGLETRISVRSRIPAAILGVREGLGGSALNAGNYQATRRLWADTWFSPSVQALCAAGEAAFPPPFVGSELWYDPADVLLLQEDAQDAASIMATNATALQALDSAGYDADAAVAAVRDGNLSALIGAHDGLQSVQRQPTGGEGDTDG